MLRILLAIDGSEQSEAAVEEAIRRRFPAKRELRIISVIEPPPYFPDGVSGDGVNMSLYLDFQETARERGRAAVEKAAAMIRRDKQSDQLLVSTEVVLGSPKQMILEEAEKFGADLILVGSHGHGMVERFLLGSVSQAVALHAKCSVEIVRSPKGHITSARTDQAGTGEDPRGAGT